MTLLGLCSTGRVYVRLTCMCRVAVMMAVSQLDSRVSVRRRHGVWCLICEWCWLTVV